MKEFSPKVLVLLAAFNGEEFIVDQIKSILNQRHVSVHILIQDDVSTDSTRKLLINNFSLDQRISIVFNKKRSGSAFLNFISLFINCSINNFDYIALSDQDDIWYQDKIYNAINLMSLNSADCYSCSVKSFWPSGKTRKISQSNSIMLADFIFEGAGQGCTFLLSQKFFKEFKYFINCNFKKVSLFSFHDWLIYIAARTWGYKWYFDNKINLNYRQHDNNEIGSRGSIGALVRRWNLVFEGWYSDQILKAIEIYYSLGGNSYDIINFQPLFLEEKSFKRQFFLCNFVLRYSRRRLLDRFVLFFFAAFFIL